MPQRAFLDGDFTVDGDTGVAGVADPVLPRLDAGIRVKRQHAVALDAELALRRRADADLALHRNRLDGAIVPANQ